MNVEEILNKDGFDVFFFLPGTTAATGANFDVCFPVSRPCELAKVRVCYSVASSSGTFLVQRLRGTTAPGAGTNLFSTAISLSATANTVYERNETDFVTNASRAFVDGDRLSFNDGGTLTSLQNLSVILYFRPVGKGHYR